MSDTEEETNYYHCHRSCGNYDTPCKSPGKCKQQKKENKPCPIKSILGEHLCGEAKQIPERDFNRINRGRKSDQRLDRVGIVGDMIEYRETRDYVHNIGDAIQVHYLEVIEKSSEEEDSDGNQAANITADSQGWYPWDYYNSEDERRYQEMSEENSETEEEEYEVEDYYKEVKRFSELTKEEIDIVAGKLRNISPKFEDLFRAEIKGGREDREYEQIVEE